MPNFMQEQECKLGTVVDGHLLSSQIIQERTSNPKAITGDFSREEALDIATTLNAGPLPLKIRFVDSNVLLNR